MAVLPLSGGKEPLESTEKALSRLLPERSSNLHELQSPLFRHSMKNYRKSVIVALTGGLEGGERAITEGLVVSSSLVVEAPALSGLVLFEPVVRL